MKKILLFALPCLVIALTSCDPTQKGKDYYEGTNGKPVNYEKAFKYFTKGAEKGNAEAQYGLANCYYNGHGTLADTALAVSYYRLAADQEHCDAMCQLATYLDDNIQDPKLTSEEYHSRLEEIVKLFEKGAQKGHVLSQAKLGRYLLIHDYNEGDEERGYKWVLKAAEQNHPEGIYLLGSCYRYGRYVKKSWKTAGDWWEKAAKLGHAQAQYEIGNFYLWGDGGRPKDYEKALEWFHKAAKQNNADAQNAIGSCYYRGAGVEKDRQKAKEWFQKAADQGHYYAKQNLRSM